MDAIYSVTEINRKVKHILEDESDLSNIFIIGEMSNVKYYRSGHLYFSLKDKKSTLKCAAFNHRYKSIDADLKDGDQVKAFGRIGLYEAGGMYQFIVDHIEKQNKLGELYEKLEKIKEKLSKKGYFDLENKKILPELPLSIGVVTSNSGAAIRDIINIRNQRNINTNIFLYPTRVQGEGAESEIIRGIEVLNKMEEVDVIIIGRGGGSIEDLWAFNSEDVAEAVFNSNKPIISAVGHESDSLLTDFVADIRAATPTNSIEILLKSSEDLEKKIFERETRIKNLMELHISEKKEYLIRQENSYILRHFIRSIEDKRQNLVEKEDKIIKVISNIIREKQSKLELIENRLEMHNRMKILKKGYSIVMKNGKIIRKKEELSINDGVKIVLSNGEAISEIKDIM